MKVRGGFDLPDDRREKFQRGLRLEWWSIGFIASIAVVMYLTMGSSQAMKAAWVEDALSLLPPIAILVAARYRNREANERFPYGYHRAVDAAFLATALVLFVLGSYILYDSVHSLVTRHHPTIGSMVIFGHPIWAGWVMIAALVYSIVPPVVLGRMKLPIAKEVHDKALHADADINKADWMTGGAGILGILGIGLGFWWADSAAATIISIDIVRDGLKNLARVTHDLLDERPTSVEDDEPLGLDAEIRHALQELDWVVGADARLREEGHLVAGEVYVIPAGDSVSLDQIQEAAETATGVDWRLHDLIVTLVPEVNSAESPARRRR